MTGQRDYLLRIVTPDLELLRAFPQGQADAPEGVASIEFSFALGQVKRSNALPV